MLYDLFKVAESLSDRSILVNSLHLFRSLPLFWRVSVD